MNRKKQILLQLTLMLIAFFSLGDGLSDHPLVDYDEATYAKIALDTLDSGDILSLKKYTDPWLVNPPLNFWSSMVSLKIFGTNEFAFRFPSVVLAVLSLWVVFLLAREQTKSHLIAASAFLILLFSPPFFAFSRELRLDAGLVLGILLTVFVLVKGWSSEKYLLFVFPAMSFGFFFKSFGTISAVFAILCYSLFFKQWAWMKSKYLWAGFLMSVILVLPWHILQFKRFGMFFAERYFIWHVYQRTISTLTGSNNYSDFLVFLWKHNQPWTALLAVSSLALLGLFFVRKKINHKFSPVLPASLFSAISIVLFFSLVRTHLSPYILPAYPFIAIFVAVFLWEITSLFRIRALAAAAVFVMLIFGAKNSFRTTEMLVPPYLFEEKNLGLILRNNPHRAPVYVLDWPFLETISYYGNTKMSILRLQEDPISLKAPFYLVTNRMVMTYFYNREGKFIDGYEKVQELFKGSYLVLVYSDEDLILPKFSHR